MKVYQDLLAGFQHRHRDGTENTKNTVTTGVLFGVRASRNCTRDPSQEKSSNHFGPKLFIRSCITA